MGEDDDEDGDVIAHQGKLLASGKKVLPVPKRRYDPHRTNADREKERVAALEAAGKAKERKRPPFIPAKQKMLNAVGQEWGVKLWAKLKKRKVMEENGAKYTKWQCMICNYIPKTK